MLSLGRVIETKLLPLVAAAALSSLATAACVDNSGNTDIQCRALAATEATSLAARDGSPFQGTVFTIVMENKSVRQILQGGDAPYIQSLAEQYAVAGNYTDAYVHPSKPNYIWMVAGQNFGILDNDAPESHHIAATAHLADQIERAGLTWKSYQQSMGEPCTIESNYPYEPKHNPFIYFDDIVGWDGQQLTRQPRCREHVVDYSELAADLAAGTVPGYVFITPDMQHDMHDGSISSGDDWLSRELPKIFASDAFQNGGVLFLTWDEGSTRSASNWEQDDDPPMIVISPLAKQGYVSQEPYDTSSYVKTVQALLGLDALPCGETPDAISTMDDLFTVALPDEPVTRLQPQPLRQPRW